MGEPRGTITLFVPFIVIHAREVSVSSLEVAIHRELNEGKIPCAVVEDWDDGWFKHPHSWLLSRSKSEGSIFGLPEMHTATAMIIRSRTFIVGEDNFERELRLTLERSLSLRQQGYFITTTKQCRLQVSLGVQGGTLPPVKLLNLCYTTTVFERCLDGLSMAHCIKHTTKRRDYSVEDQLRNIVSVGTIEELALCVSGGLGKTLKIEDQSTVSFGNHHGTLDVERILMWCTVLISLFRYCWVAEHGHIQELAKAKSYDLRYSSLEFLADIMTENRVRAYYAEHLQSTSSLGGVDQYDTTSCATGSLLSTMALTRLERSKARSCQPKAVRCAMSNKYHDGGYGTDLLRHNGGNPLFPEDFDDCSLRPSNADFVAESIERDDPAEVELAMQANAMVMNELSESSDDESHDEGDTCPSLMNTSRSASRSFTPPSTQDFDVQAHRQLVDVFDMSGLRRCLPQTPGEKSEARYNMKAR